MVRFVNAKINIGLNIVGKREDGYHLLESVFYPVGIYAGTPVNPSSFNDILELTEGNSFDIPDYESHGIRFYFEGVPMDCEPEKNLIVKAAEKILKEASAKEINGILKEGSISMDFRVYKNLPFGAGLGGGSADASFTLKMINEILVKKGFPGFNDKELKDMAVSLGADCPFFIHNRPAYVEGIGEKMEELPEFLKGKWLVIVKPDLHISTKEAFAGISVMPSSKSLKELIEKPFCDWRSSIKNDFETTLFPKYPELKRLKESLYESGAEYASMSGSGAALYGIFTTEESADQCYGNIKCSYKVKLLI